MNDINGIDGYGGPNAIQPPGRQGSRSDNIPSSPARTPDQVEISPIAHLLQKIALLPEIRAEKVNPTKETLAQGTYDVEGKLSMALDRLLDEYTQD